MSQSGGVSRNRGRKVECPYSPAKKTDYVIVGEEPGSKADKARELEVKTLNEKEFLKLIGSD